MNGAIPVERNAVDRAFGPSGVCRHSPVSASHSRIVLSAAGVASIRPSGDHAMRPIQPVWPRSVRTSFTPGGRLFRTSSSARRHSSFWSCSDIGSATYLNRAHPEPFDVAQDALVEGGADARRRPRARRRSASRSLRIRASFFNALDDVYPESHFQVDVHQTRGLYQRALTPFDELPNLSFQSVVPTILRRASSGWGMDSRLEIAGMTR